MALIAIVALGIAMLTFPAIQALGAGLLASAGVISIVAGLKVAALQEAAGMQARIVRVMPNTPALIGKGAAAYALGSSATEAIARQPEASGDIRGAMILAAALIEGVALIALVVSLLIVLK